MHNGKHVPSLAQPITPKIFLSLPFLAEAVEQMQNADSLVFLKTYAMESGLEGKLLAALVVK